MNVAQASIDWWDEIKKDGDKLCKWLVRQYIGEVTAVSRIHKVLKAYEGSISEESKKLLNTILKDEARHALMVSELLVARGVSLPKINREEAEKRYWSKVLPSIESFEDAAAVGAHAEEMRLNRIKAIVNDEESPIDIRAVFSDILPDEEFHALAFTSMTTEEALRKNEGNHKRGLEILGLEA